MMFPFFFYCIIFFSSVIQKFDRLTKFASKIYNEISTFRD